MKPHISELWVYLATSPLLWLAATLLAYQAGHALYRRAGSHPAANPVLIAIAVLVALLKLTHTPFEHYFDGAQFVHFLLGPATVALAIPLYAQMKRVRALLLPMAVALVAGCLAATFSAVWIGRWLGASPAVVMSLAPKSVTTPIAMGVAERLGGIPSLTAVLVIVTGILGAVCARPILDRLRVRSHAMRGFAIGLAAHGIGTARAFQESEETGAFAALGMGLNGLLTAALLPLVI
ncbi:MAG: LrgB family protein [Rhodocyclaceae bacterium]|nr:LrgB family protein [Rhodocyclaceae bacterium]